MVKLKIDKQSHYKNTEFEQRENNSIVFYQDNWNDFGYSVLFDVYYYDDIGKEYSIGFYKIFHTKEPISKWNGIKLSQRTVSSLEADKKLDDLDFSNPRDKQYFSIAPEQSFYTQLYNLFPEKYDDILKKLNDITSTFSDEIEEILQAESLDKDNRDIYENVIFRNFSSPSTSTSRKALKLYQTLVEIDNNLHLGNYSDDDYIDLILNSEYEQKRKFLEYFYNANYNFLEKIVDKYCQLRNTRGDSYNIDDDFRFIKDLINKAEDVNKGDYSQLKSTIESLVNSDLSIISDAVNSIKSRLKYSATEEIRFVHYTSMNTLSFLIKKEEKKDGRKDSPLLRVSNARQMNDPNEGITLYDLIDLQMDVPNIEDDYEPSPFYFASMAGLTSENKIDDSLPMWKMYGGDSEGICLTYSNDYIENIIDANIEIYKVVYKDNIERNVNDELERIKTSFAKIDRNNEVFTEALRLIEPIRYLFKESDYAYENEYRIIVNYEGKEKELVVESSTLPPRLYAYIDSHFLKYSNVKIGPNAQDIDFIAPYIKYVDRDIKVSKSLIPYRKT